MGSTQRYHLSHWTPRIRSPIESIGLRIGFIGPIGPILPNNHIGTMAILSHITLMVLRTQILIALGYVIVYRSTI